MKCPFPPGSLVIAYLRYSTGDQNLASQDHALRSWCAEHQLALSHVFQDEAQSGATTAGRHEFMRMIELLLGNPQPRPAGIILWSLSRFSRDYDDAQYFKALLRHAGYAIHSMTDEIPDGRVGRIVEAVHDYMNDDVARRASYEAKRGMHDLARQGLNSGGFPPRGYRKSPGISLGRRKDGSERIAHRWEIDPECESRVRQAWQMKLAGETNWAIHRATRLYKGINCYPTFFRNRTYLGERRCGEIATANAHPAYVAPEEFERVQKMKRPMQRIARSEHGNPNHPRRQRSPFLLSGILFCGACGAAMVGDRSKSYAYYRCGRQGRQGRHACDQPRISSPYLDRSICDWLSDHVLTADRLRSIRDRVQAELDQQLMQIEPRRTHLLAEQSRLDATARRLVDAVEKAGPLPELVERIAQRQAEARSIAMELAEIETWKNQERIELSESMIEQIAGEMRGNLLSGSASAREIVRSAVVRIDYADHRARLQYLLPLAAFGVKNVPPREHLLFPNWLSVRPEYTELEIEPPRRGRRAKTTIP